MKVYVASSWRNEFQPAVVKALRTDGHEVYDFKDAEGLGWSEVDPDWQKWTLEIYLRGLKHEHAERGFNRDMKALKECEVCVMVMPCGMSASLETGIVILNEEAKVIQENLNEAMKESFSLAAERRITHRILTILAVILGVLAVVIMLKM